MIAVIRLPVLLSLILISGAPRAVTLDALLTSMEDGAAVNALEAERQRLAIEHQHRTEERGWSVFGGANTGYFRELQPAGEPDTYANFGASIGLRYPLLGSLEKRNRAVTDAELAVIRQSYETGQRRSDQRSLLSQSYIDWWYAWSVSRWCEQWRPIIEEELASARKRAGRQALRTSELQWLEQRWDRLTRSCERSTDYESLLRERTGQLAGAVLTARERPERPTLNDQPAPLSEWTRALNNLPAVAARQRALETAASEREDHWSDRIDSSFTISQRLDRRGDTPGTGSGLVAGVTFEVPLATLTGNEAGSADKARYRAARERLMAEFDQWRRFLEDNLLGYGNALDDVAEARDQLALAERLSSERQQRLTVDSESGYMAMRTARVEEAEAHLNLFRAWRGASLERVGLTRMAEHADNPAKLLGGQPIPWPAEGKQLYKAGPVRATYVWNSQPLLAEAEQRRAHLQAMANTGINRIYLGLNSAQVAQPEELQGPMDALVREASDHGIRVDLLLGDPLWLTEQHREDLAGLIRQLSSLPFAGLHLDLEVEQLGWPVPEQRLEQWVDTVAAASAASPWPVTLVSHHRWFSDSANPETCVPCRLPEQGIQTVSLMIYTTRPERSGELMERAKTLWPAMTFRLAQSVEKSLPGSQSWHGRTATELARVEQTLERQGIHAIEWQDWQNHPAYPDISQR